MRMANLDGFVAVLRVSDFEIYFAKKYRQNRRISERHGYD